MPGGDRTGPAGAGPRTGRAQGYCAGRNEPGYVTAGAGRGGPRAGGRGRGMRRRGRGQGQGNGWGARRQTAENQLNEAVDLPPSVLPEQPPVAEPVVESAADVDQSVQDESDMELNVLNQQLAAVQHQAEKIAERIEQLQREK